MFNFNVTRLGGVLVAASVLVACGDDDVTDPVELDTIAATAAASSDLSTLAAALDAAGLVSTLEGAGPFTVFAPRDAAFEALGEDVVVQLLEDGNLDLLSRLLTFHVVDGAAVFSSDLSDGQTVTTVEGGELTIGVSGGSVTVNGANVVTADVEASNGVVHIVDDVLLPADTDIYETAVLTSATTELSAAIGAADLTSVLQGDGPFTVFAPVDEAFLALGEYKLDVLFAEGNEDLLSKILTFHVIADEVLAGELTDGGTATTVQGGTLTFDLGDASDPKVNGVSITTTDIQVENGVIHLVDEVLLPELDVVETATLEIATATLVDAIVAAELGGALSSAGPFTVFAPVNGAFEDLGASTVANLLDQGNQAILQDLLQYHVIEGDIRLGDLTDGQMATTLEGGQVTFDLSGSTPKINGADITVTDIETANGVIHLIDGVLTESLNIVERASVTSATSTLADAVVAASTNGSTDVAAVLSGDGPYTVFAPLNEAFEELGTDRLDVLLDPANAELLTKVLTFHVVPGDIRAADLSDGAMATTLEGTDLTFDLSDPQAPKVNGIDIITTDIVTENGVIHLINGVLTDNLDLVDVATVEGFSTLVSLVEQQGLTSTLRGDNMGDGYTVFAPTNDAFDALTSVPSGDALTNVLLYHVAPAAVESSALSDAQVVGTAYAGHDFTVNIDGSVTITDESGNTVNVVLTDVAAANGIIHVIDAVLIPTP